MISQIWLKRLAEDPLLIKIVTGTLILADLLVGNTAEVVGPGIARIEGKGTVEITNRFWVLLQLQIGPATFEVGLSMLGLERESHVKIADRLLIALQSIVGRTTTTIDFGIARV